MTPWLGTLVLCMLLCVERNRLIIPLPHLTDAGGAVEGFSGSERVGSFSFFLSSLGLFFGGGAVAMFVCAVGLFS
jgi:hypothetical protein